ncbi:hypothetical protein ACSBR2_014908 [Camellia fascicularis]
MKTILMDLISEKRVALERNGASPCQDLITCLLCIGNEDNSSLLSDEEIKDDAVIIMIGGYNTSSILFTLLIRFLANEPSIYAAIVEAWTASMSYMDGTIFPNPSKIDPTRFEQHAQALPYCFVAFGGGPIMCPGYEFTRIETLAMIHYLVTQTTWKLSCIDDSFCRDLMPIFN